MTPARHFQYLLSATALLCAVAAAQAQPFGYNAGQFELSPDVSLDEAPAEARKLREQTEAILASGRYGEAIDHLVRLILDHGDRLTPLTPQRYVRLADECQLRLIGLPTEALEIYRERVDPEAKEKIDRARATRDSSALKEVADTMLASGFGDDALWLLGEMQWEQGDLAGARASWEKLVPNPPAPAGERVTRLAHPSPDYPLSAVLARLVLVSIVEGDLVRAGEELAAYRRQFPEAKGRLGGREVVYAEHLQTLLDEARGWPTAALPKEWTTLAGNPSRSATWPSAIDVGPVVWRIPLGSEATDARRGEPRYFPVVSGGRVFVADELRILAADVATGRPAWGQSLEIYTERGASRSFNPRSALGSPRYSLTIHGQRLLARLGPPETSQVAENFQSASASIVCLDLAAQGRLDWRITPEEGWLFEGPPVCDGQSVYLMQRRSDVRPQSHVACYDAATGRQRWRRFVCGAETPARGQYSETTHGLVSLDRGSLYVCTNLGGVAALDASDGRIRWLYRYPRVTRGELNASSPHYDREPTTCLVAQGLVLCAPADGESLLALDAAQGQLAFESSGAGPVRHVLGVVGRHVVVSGDRLAWIDLATGRLDFWWPDGPQPRGYGRGLIAGGQVLWPTRDAIHAFDGVTGHPLRKIALRTPEGGATGGNLVPAPGRLLIATADELVALDAAPSVAHAALTPTSQP